MDISTLPKAKKMNVANLPVMAREQIDHSSLPALYLAAKEALIDCDRVDEIKGIASKHSAIAHYAKQIKDDSLRFYAQRIHLRALHRIGELLIEIKDPKERTKIQKQYGLTQTEKDDAWFIGHLGRSELDKMVEKTPPASKWDCRGAGWQKSPSAVKARDRHFAQQADHVLARYETTPYEHATYLLDALLDEVTKHGPPACLSAEMFNFAGANVYRHKEDYMLPDAVRWGQMLAEDEARKIRPAVLKLIEWLDDFDRGMPR
jgi:hypothetical protein